MSKAVKQLMVDEMVRRLEGSEGLLVASTMGLPVNETVAFRAALREKQVRAMVVKNSLCGRALDAIGLGYAKVLLDGPTTVIYGGDTLVDTAKALVEAAKKYPQVVVRGGAMDGAVMSAADVESLSKLPTREEMIGMVVSSLLSPVSGVIGALTSPASQVASQIEKLSERADEKEAA